MANILTPSQVLKRGLEILGCDEKAQQRVNRSTNTRRFKRNYGPAPLVVSVVWQDLQTTDIVDAKVEAPTTKDLDMFLLTLFFVKNIPTEEVIALRFKVNEKTARKWTRHYISKVAALKAIKIVWPDDWDTTFIISVDCVNFGLNEPRHPTLHKDKRYFDRKGGKAGFTYEIALHLWESRIVWINGPFPAATGDAVIYKTQGLMDKIPAGKKAIADKIYVGCNKIALHNSLDTEEVREFKGRSRARQESINARLKSYAILRNRFRLGKDCHQDVFTAVAVLVAYQMENGSPLFAV